MQMLAGVPPPVERRILHWMVGGWRAARTAPAPGQSLRARRGEGAVALAVRCGRGVWQTAPRAAGVLLTVFLACAVALGTLVQGQAWLRGEHLTPEHLAYHLQLERLGLPDHHAPPPATARGAGTGVVGAAVAPGGLPAPGPALASATAAGAGPALLATLPAFAAPTEGKYCLGCQLPAPPGPATGPAHPWYAAAAVLEGLRLEPPDDPPRPVS